ncbi:MAG: hypothetical protein HIU91_03495, partial [Acidobacteria bacterium]|nr:hypothetical protein [Acidobacteriota bacterium]
MHQNIIYLSLAVPHRARPAPTSPPQIPHPATFHPYPHLMRISFVVPAYNEEAYLPACLDS